MSTSPCLQIHMATQGAEQMCLLLTLPMVSSAVLFCQLITRIPVVLFIQREIWGSLHKKTERT